MSKEPNAFTVKYGFRVVVPVSLVSIFAIFLLVEYLLTGRKDSILLALAIAFFVIDLILIVGFGLTTSSRITKKYYHTETLIGQNGRVIKGVPARNTGTVTVSSEDWSFTCDSDTSDNEIVTIVDVFPDNVTLKVRKTS